MLSKHPTNLYAMSWKQPCCKTQIVLVVSNCIQWDFMISENWPINGSNFQALHQWTVVKYHLSTSCLIPAKKMLVSYFNDESNNNAQWPTMRNLIWINFKLHHENSRLFTFCCADTIMDNFMIELHILCTNLIQIKWFI